jgi:hypothetical protein
VNRLSDLFPKALCPGSIEPFMHKGDWAIHNVLPFLLEQIGPADVEIATFSISEDSIRPLFFLAESGLINRLTLLLDTTVKRHKLDMLLFAANITADIRISACHAKVLLIENKEYQFGIVGSANMNLNQRWESGFYFTSGYHFNYFKNAFKEAYNQSIIFNL